MSTLEDIEKLAQNLAQAAAKKDTPVQEMLDALKILAPYYTALSKAKIPEESGDDEPNMGDIQRKLRLVEGDNLG